VNYVWGATAVFLVWETMVCKEVRQLKNYLLIATTIFFVIAIIGEIANAVIKSRIKKQ
jgi:large-conductance mechanosensitive channel